MTLPAKQGFPAARTRFDDLQMVHVKQTADGPIHGVGGFLPFHRYYINLHEKLLRTECNYTGGQPYWNETIDAGSFSKSILLTSDPGFGGNGSGSKGCITDGPFKDYVNSIGPGQTNKDHCIDRKINEGTSAGAKKDNVDCCMQQSTYVDAWHCLEGQIHSAGHGGIGGQVCYSRSSNLRLLNHVDVQCVLVTRRPSVLYAPRMDRQTLDGLAGQRSCCTNLGYGRHQPRLRFRNF